MVNLFDEYNSQVPSQGINLFDEYNESNRKGTPEEALELAKKQISSKHPNMPDWLRDAILHITPRERSPLLESAGRGISNVTNIIPAAFGGALQGASVPIRGIASTIPTKITQDFANSPDLRSFFPQPETGLQQGVQTASEFAGGAAPFAKLFGALKGLSQSTKIPKTLQNSVALAGTGYLGTPGDAVDKLVGTAGALGAGALGKVAQKSFDKLSPVVRGIFNESSPEAIIESVQKPHDILKREADDFYNKIDETIKKRNIKVNIDPKYLDEILEYPSMDSKVHRELVQKAKDGDYEAVHKLQSSMYKKGTKDISNDDSVVETRGENLLSLRDKLNEEMNKSFLNDNHWDVSYLLGQARKRYSDLQKTYFDKLLPKGIGKLVHQETRLIPENVEALFKQNSVPMKRFLSKHPEIEKHIQGLKDKKEANKILKRLALGTGIAGGGIAGSKTIYDLLK